MPLSEYEKSVLEQMERALSQDDPKLANKLAKSGRRPWGRRKGAPKSRKSKRPGRFMERMEQRWERRQQGY